MNGCDQSRSAAAGLCPVSGEREVCDMKVCDMIRRRIKRTKKTYEHEVL